MQAGERQTVIKARSFEKRNNIRLHDSLSLSDRPPPVFVFVVVVAYFFKQECQKERDGVQKQKLHTKGKTDALATLNAPDAIAAGKAGTAGRIWASNAKSAR